MSAEAAPTQQPTTAQGSAPHRPPLTCCCTHASAPEDENGDAASSRSASVECAKEVDATARTSRASSTETTTTAAPQNGFDAALERSTTVDLSTVPVAVDLVAQPHLRRALSVWSLTALGVGATIGAGIFVMTGVVAKELAGPSMCLSFVLAAVVCFFSGLCYAEFASISPSAGSAYAYTRATLGQFAGWMIGWNLVLEYTVAAAAVASSWSQYFNEFLGLLGGRIPFQISNPPFEFDQKTNSVVATGAWFNLPAFLISVLITIVLICGVRESTRFNNVMVGLKVSIVLFVICLGATLVDTANYHPFAPYGYLGLNFFGTPIATTQETASGQATGMMAGSAIVFFAYIGFDSVSCQSEEAKRPERDVPLAMCASLGISTVLYVGVSIVLTGMVKYSEIDMNAPLSTVFTQKGHHWAGYFVAIGAVAGMTSVLLVSMLSQPRIFLAMSRHGLLPPCMGWVHPHFKTPWVSTLVTGAVVAVISCVIPISILVSFVSIGTLVAFLFVCVAVVVLRHTQPDLYRPFRCPWVPFVPITGGLLCLLLMFSLPVNTWYRLLVWMAVGVLIYLLYGRRHGIGERYHMETRAELDAAQHAGAEPPTLGSLELGSKAHSANLSAGSLKTLREMVESRNKELEMRVRMNSDFNKPVQVWRKESNPPKIPPTIDESAAAAPAGLRIDEVETPVKAETPTDQGDEEWREYRYSIASQNESTAGPGLPGAPAAGADQDHHYEASTHSVGELEERKQPRYEYERRRSSM